VNKESSTDWEIAIDLPLGVVASQLVRIEEQLRLLNMKAADFVKQRDTERRNGAIAARLEHINRALDAIRTLMADIETDIDTTRWTSDAVFTRAPARKPYPERDD
jgi:hypothetical protein